MKNFAIEFLEKILKQIEKYNKEYEKYSKPYRELWSFKLEVHDFSEFGRKELQKIYIEIEEALNILKVGLKND